MAPELHGARFKKFESATYEFQKNQSEISCILGSAEMTKFVDLSMMNSTHSQNLKIHQICYLCVT
jgi:hypothetical protein